MQRNFSAVPARTLVYPARFALRSVSSTARSLTSRAHITAFCGASTAAAMLMGPQPHPISGCVACAVHLYRPDNPVKEYGQAAPSFPNQDDVWRKHCEIRLPRSQFRVEKQLCFCAHLRLMVVR